jgi:hypothetical protein
MTFIVLLHNVRRLVAQSLLLKQTVASSQASTNPEVPDFRWENRVPPIFKSVHGFAAALASRKPQKTKTDKRAWISQSVS